MSMPSNASTLPTAPSTADSAVAEVHETSEKIDLVDYERVRDEIDNRTTLSSQLLNYDLIIVGAVISAYG